MVAYRSRRKAKAKKTAPWRGSNKRPGFKPARPPFKTCDFVENHLLMLSWADYLEDISHDDESLTLSSSIPQYPSFFSNYTPRVHAVNPHWPGPTRGAF